MKVTCIGGGAASFFFAANASEMYPDADITILEQGKKYLSKVSISGGGRCNVTHHCFEPKELVKNYPRGEKVLLKPFKQFGPQDTIDWFAERGVKIKKEADGRMFPVTDSSQTIIDCLVNNCRKHGVKIDTGTKVTDIQLCEDKGKSHFITTLAGDEIETDVLFIGAGSSATIWKILKTQGFNIVDPVPSLFTFKITDKRLQGLSGISLDHVRLRIPGTPYAADGPMLITHKGLSGPAVLKLSAIGAHHFHEQNYNCDLSLDLRPDITDQTIKSWRDDNAKKLMGNHQVLGLPKRLTAQLIEIAELDGQKKYASISKKDMQSLIDLLKKSRFDIAGQNRFKEEFVTAGGIDHGEINFKNFSSNRYPNLFFAGEILNIDAVTGGFNFQAAWTGAYLAALGMRSVMPSDSV